LAVHFGGALPFERLECMTSRQIDRYYRVYEWQAIEEQIRDEHLHPAPPAKAKGLPSPENMAKLIRKRIAERGV